MEYNYNVYQLAIRRSIYRATLTTLVSFELLERGRDMYESDQVLALDVVMVGLSRRLIMFGISP